MDILAIILLVILVVGACCAGGMLLSGFILMTDDGVPLGSRPKFVWWRVLDHLLTGGILAVLQSLRRNWRVRDYARRTIIRGLCIGVTTVLLAIVALRMLADHA